MIHVASISKHFEEALLAVDRVSAQQILQNALRDSGQTETIDHVVTAALEHIGAQWETGQVALSQVYMSGVICEEFIAGMVLDHTEEAAEMPPMAIVTFEDYQALAKRIVLSILHAQGLPVKDFGVGIHAEPIVRMVLEQEIKILLISTLMFPSALHIARVREQLDQAGHAVKIVVGGAPFRFDDQLWQKVGADAMGRTAADAVKLTKQFLEHLRFEI